MTTPDPEKQFDVLAAESLAAGDPTGWFERLYVAASAGDAQVPWDRGAPHQLLAEWAESRSLEGGGRRALVVGAGLGRDSEYVAGHGFATVAFDISDTAVRTARERHPDSTVEYLAADLLDPPSEWRQAFDLVVESMTVQALPDPPRHDAIVQIGQFVAPGGTLLVIAAAREESDAADGPPWPLVRAEVDAFAAGGLRSVRVEDLRDAQDPSIRRWRAEFRRL